jgi:hypothetical protein
MPTAQDITRLLAFDPKTIAHVGATADGHIYVRLTDGSLQPLFTDAAAAAGAVLSADVAATAEVDISEPPATIDGVPLEEGLRVLLTDQTDPLTNGLYEFVGGELVRHAAFNVVEDVTGSLLIAVLDGTMYGIWVLMTPTPAILGTAELFFARVATVGGGGGGDATSLRGVELHAATVGAPLHGDVITFDSASGAYKALSAGAASLPPAEVGQLLQHDGDEFMPVNDLVLPYTAGAGPGSSRLITTRLGSAAGSSGRGTTIQGGAGVSADAETPGGVGGPFRGRGGNGGAGNALQSGGDGGFASLVGGAGGADGGAGAGASGYAIVDSGGSDAPVLIGVNTASEILSGHNQVTWQHTGNLRAALDSDSGFFFDHGLMSSLHSNSFAAAGLTLRRSHGSFASPTSLEVGDSIGAIYWSPHDGTDYGISAAIMAHVVDAVSTNYVQTRLNVYVGSAVGELRIPLQIDEQRCSFWSDSAATNFNSLPTGGVYVHQTQDTSPELGATLALIRTNAGGDTTTGDQLGQVLFGGRESSSDLPLARVAATQTTDGSGSVEGQLTLGLRDPTSGDFVDWLTLERDGTVVAAGEISIEEDTTKTHSFVFTTADATPEDLDIVTGTGLLEHEDITVWASGIDATTFDRVVLARRALFVGADDTSWSRVVNNEALGTDYDVIGVGGIELRYDGSSKIQLRVTGKASTSIQWRIKVCRDRHAVAA